MGWQHGVIGGPRPVDGRRSASRFAVRSKGTTADWLVSSVDDDLWELIGSQAEQAVRTAIAKRPLDDRRHLHVRGAHLICGFLAEMADAVAVVAAAGELVGDAVAAAAFPASRRDGVDVVAVAVMRTVVSNLVTLMVETAAIQQLGPVVAMLRIAAIATCPDTTAHPGLDQAIADLAGEPVSEELTSVLRQTLHAHAGEDRTSPDEETVSNAC